MSNCYICRQTGVKTCEPHCGLCQDLEITSTQFDPPDHFADGLPGLADRDFDHVSAR